MVLTILCAFLFNLLHAGTGAEKFKPGVYLEGLEPLLDGLSIVITAPTGLASAQQPLLHGLKGTVEKEDQPGQADSLLKRLRLHTNHMPMSGISRLSVAWTWKLLQMSQSINVWCIHPGLYWLPLHYRNP